MKVKILKYRILMAYGPGQYEIAPECWWRGLREDDIEDTIRDYIEEGHYRYSDKYRGFEWEWEEHEIPNITESTDNRLQEFTDKAREYCNKNLPMGWSQHSWGCNYRDKIIIESIVKECLEKISGLIVPETFEQSIGPYEKWNQALGHAALDIEQHFFGDEE